MVYLVGAGPGDSGLITQKGLECIKKADVIIYDHLANPTLLSYAKNDCKLIYAGKIAGNHHMVQEEINKTLVEHSRFGNVVRLKGGDPFIFGRGGEEIIALIENNIDYEIVPGISSCYSAAEYCGIPVTHRGVATSFHVITGHEKVGNETVNYSALAKLSGTLVFLMGLSSAENISNKLIENGAGVAINPVDVVKAYADRFDTLDMSKLRESNQIALDKSEQDVNMARIKPRTQNQIKQSNPDEEKYSFKNVEKSREHRAKVEEKAIELQGNVKIVYDCLDDEYNFIDDVIAKSNLPASSVLAALTVLEIKKLIISASGKRFKKS